MSESEALLAIQDLMDGVEWTSETLDGIANIMRSAGYLIRDLEEVNCDQNS